MLSAGERRAQVELLTRINASEFLDALGLGSVRGWARRALLWLCAPAARRPYLLNVDVSVLDGRLSALWTYSRARHEPKTIRRVAMDFMMALRELTR